MALAWTWDENIPQEIKNDKKSDVMVQRFILALARESKSDFASPRRTSSYESDLGEEERQVPVDVRPQWKIDNERRFRQHVAEMEEWLNQTGMRNHPAVGSAFDRFVQWSDPETTIEINYYTRGDALRDYDDYEDFMSGY